jgi:hypothetical protein
VGADGDLTRFPVDLVRQHAGTVDRVSEAMEAARSAIHEITMDTGAYGQLCQFLPAVLSPIFGMGADALRGSVDSLQTTAVKLRTAATNTHSTDAGSGQRITAAGNEHRPRIELPL